MVQDEWNNGLPFTESKTLLVNRLTRALWPYRKEEKEAMGSFGMDPRSHNESRKQTLGKVGMKTSKGVRRHPEIGRIVMVSKVKRRMD